MGLFDEFGWSSGGTIFDEIESGKNPLKDLESTVGKEVDFDIKSLGHGKGDSTGGFGWWK
jgi:hypothetical protein